MTQNQKIQYGTSGEEVVFRPPFSVLWGQTIIQSIFVIGVGILIYWSGPAIIRYFQDGEITGALRHLERFSFSPRAMLISVIVWCLFLTWWGVGGLYEVLKIQLQRDRFILRSDGLVVQRRNIGARELRFPVHEPFALRLRPEDGALEALTARASHVLTSLGTPADRQWLLELLQKRYRTPMELPVLGAIARERVATYLVERQPGGTLQIASSGLASIGCAIMALVLCVICVSAGILMLSKGSGAGVILFMFTIAIAVGGLGALNRRKVIATRGHLRVEWTSPVGKILLKFLPRESPVLKTQLGEGHYEATNGTLAVRTAFKQKGSATHRVVLLQEMKSGAEAKAEEEEEVEEEDVEDLVEDEEDLEFVDDPRMESLIVDLHGDTRPAADHLCRLLSETTGFPQEEFSEEEN